MVAPLWPQASDRPFNCGGSEHADVCNCGAAASTTNPNLHDIPLNLPFRWVYRGHVQHRNRKRDLRRGGVP
jgi:hypothetical protein